MPFASSMLIVDDSEADSALIEIAARTAGISRRITRCSDGESALAYLNDPANELPDLVLLDLGMPGLSGHEVLTAIRDSDRLGRIPVVILSSSEDSQDISRCYDERANAYVVKPIGMEGFNEVMASIEKFWFSVVRLPAGSAA